jgi:3',5'-cyclic-nucleotide phosphodiesterase
MKNIFVLAFCLSCMISNAQVYTKSFKIIPLGVMGGSEENNLSSYMLAAAGTDAYVCLDAGTLHAGIEKAIANKVFRKSAAEVLRQNIKGYLISHGHLDHLAGLVLNSPDDTAKNIYAMDYVINVFKEKYFSWESWANFGDEGEKPALKKYHYAVLDSAKEMPLAQTSLFVTAFPLSHGNPYESTAFLVRNGESYLLYLGDTGPDEVEKSNKLHLLWESIAPLIKAKKLKAIFIECSFPSSQKDAQLFGHLTPKWLITEMTVLGNIAGIENLKGLNVAVTHIKPVSDNEVIIKKEIKELNTLGLKILYPQQGVQINF